MWADGTRHLLFAPMELLEKLAALTPTPADQPDPLHGVLDRTRDAAPASLRNGMSPPPAPLTPNRLSDVCDDPPRPAKPRHWAWANLMRRAFDLDMLACPRCGASPLTRHHEDLAAIRAILDSLAASAERADRAPPPDTLKPATLATQV